MEADAGQPGDGLAGPGSLRRDGPVPDAQLVHEHGERLVGHESGFRGCEPMDDAVGAAGRLAGGPADFAPFVRLAADCASVVAFLADVMTDRRA